MSILQKTKPAMGRLFRVREDEEPKDDEIPTICSECEKELTEQEIQENDGLCNLCYDDNLRAKYPRHPDDPSVLP